MKIHDVFVKENNIWLLIERDAYWVIQRMGNYGSRHMGTKVYIRRVWKGLRETVQHSR